MARKIGLLFLILGFGATVETAWRVRETVGFGPLDLRLFTGKFYGNSYTFDSEESHDVPPGAALEVENAFGAVRVEQGPPGRVRVQLRKVVYRATEEQARQFAERIRLETGLSGTALRVGTNRRQVERESSQVGFETHLTLSVPPDTVVTARNEHGAVEVADVAAADVLASFEPVRVERVKGPVVVKSRHGDVLVAQAEGPLSLSAQHGDVLVRDVPRDVRLEVHHGDGEVERTGPLTVDARHGDLLLSSVSGDLTVTAAHVGVEAKDVSGKATVQTTHQEVRLSRVGGAAHVKAQHSTVAATDMAGALTVETSYGDAQVARVAGPVDVSVVHGGLDASAVSGGLRARTSGERVEVDGFAGALDVQTERGSVRLRPQGAVNAPVQVRTTHGGIELRVPDGGRFELDAQSAFGELSVDLPRFTLTRSEPRHVAGRLGTGGPTVTLAAQHGDVRVVEAGATAREAAADRGEDETEEDE
ncbi:MAG TPA: DUF4097 family beta strand repeat-containing protein [Vicinamibacteria bacterium]|jgi:DUF4097 and DUF4098 domain-containing protein YvlB